MKKIIWHLLLVSLILAGTQLSAQTGKAGTILPPEKKSWIDDSTGYRITQWTEQGSSWHLYFNIESFIDKNHAIIYSDRSGNINFYKLDLNSGEMLQMTDLKEKIDGVWHLPQYKTVWFMSGSELKSLNTETLETKSIYSFAGVTPGSFAITYNERYMVFAANKNPGYSPKHSTGPYALFRLNLSSKELKQISPDFGFNIGHVQTNPADTNIVSFCWQHQYREGGEGIVGNAPIRIWWNNLEGTDGAPVGPQEFGIHRTHEFWFPDGRHIGFSARYLWGPNKDKQFIGITTPDSKERILFPANVSAAHSQIFTDSRHWISDLYNGPYLVLFTLGKDKIEETKILFRHDSSWGAQPTHPHPHFSPDGKYVLFSTDRSGRPQVYTVEVNIGK